MPTCTDKIPKDAAGKVIASYHKQFNSILSANLAPSEKNPEGTVNVAAKIAFEDTGVILPPNNTPGAYTKAALDCGLVNDR